MITNIQAPIKIISGTKDRTRILLRAVLHHRNVGAICRLPDLDILVNRSTDPGLTTDAKFRRPDHLHEETGESKFKTMRKAV